MAKSKYIHKADHLQHIVQQQRARLEQTSLELHETEKEVSFVVIIRVQSVEKCFAPWGSLEHASSVSKL